ncbi:hypothetical protein FV768_25450 [Vibrio parahaemolyticus]|uniref:hypothetical protein n=1 Tax=Vibrio harveyi group TaxID=717610 RepID=UPI0004001EF9|nr:MULTISPECIES: hypothetical protein [Vibrio harveyi group]EGQ9819239.1 hypothetical protein [Vibrio parahaemolyticus]EJL6383391.1 hypothetical protein [Vibrio parahaemolyticus]TBT72405.1 hypothetical protein D5E70_24335 [Vibrio parahaemolyticus]TOB39799.1 hypothetical protein CGK06_21455 [Vibrio parahaemolyticus]TOC17716.1 hypothetical protein CGJ94_10460 [Vibrio parahaemolyticus]
MNGLQIVATLAMACVPDTGVMSHDALIAEAMAKGNLAQKLSSVVTAKSTYESGSEGDQLSEVIEVRSQLELSAVKHMHSGYSIVQGERQYCVEIKI